MGNRERRAAKQQRRDQRRGHVAAPRATDRGLAPETLRALLRRAGEDVAAGDTAAVSELRRVLAEHLARRRPEIVAACAEVLAAGPSPDHPSPGSPSPGSPSPGSPASRPASGPAGELAAHLTGGGDVATWAEGGGHATEDVVTATVELLAARLT